MEIKNSIDKTRQDNGYACSHECQVVVLGNMDNTIDHTFESANRVYDKNNLCPTIPTCAGGGIQPKIIEETKCVGGRSDGKWGKQYHQQDRVYKGDIALAQPANLPEGSYKYIVAMRGRNPEKPNDRTPGIPTEQRLEMAQEGMTNTLTTVQKDNLVLESCRMVRTEEGKRLRKAYENGEIKHGFNEYRELEPRKDGVCNTVTTVQKDNLVLEGVKIEDEGKENLLQILRERIEKELFCKWSIRGLFCILQTQILQQNVYAERLFENWKTSTELEQFTHNGTIDKQFVATTDSVRDLWEVWETECSSYRRQFSEQQFIEFKSFVQKLPHEDTQTKIFMFCLWEAGEGIGVLRKALSEIQEIWKPTSNKQGSWSYRIRKLTPREVWRLMGYTDEDFEKAASVVSNSQLYKTAGNAIVKQVLMAIFSQMGIKGVKRWNDMSIEERKTLVRGSIYDKANL